MPGRAVQSPVPGQQNRLVPAIWPSDRPNDGVSSFSIAAKNRADIDHMKGYNDSLNAFSGLS